MDSVIRSQFIAPVGILLNLATFAYHFIYEDAGKWTRSMVVGAAGLGVLFLVVCVLEYLRRRDEKTQLAWEKHVLESVFGSGALERFTCRRHVSGRIQGRAIGRSTALAAEGVIKLLDDALRLAREEIRIETEDNASALKTHSQVARVLDASIGQLLKTEPVALLRRIAGDNDEVAITAKALVDDMELFRKEFQRIANEIQQFWKMVERAAASEPASCPQTLAHDLRVQYEAKLVGIHEGLLDSMKAAARRLSDQTKDSWTADREMLSSRLPSCTPKCSPLA